MSVPQCSINPLLRTPEIAKLFSLSESFFKNLRITGEGPPFLKAGPKAVLYDPEAAREWLLQRQRKSITADQSRPPYTGRPRGRPRKNPLSVAPAAIDLLG